MMDKRDWLSALARGMVNTVSNLVYCTRSPDQLLTSNRAAERDFQIVLSARCVMQGL